MIRSIPQLLKLGRGREARIDTRFAKRLIHDKRCRVHGHGVDVPDMKGEDFDIDCNFREGKRTFTITDKGVGKLHVIDGSRQTVHRWNKHSR